MWSPKFGYYLTEISDSWSFPQFLEISLILGDFSNSWRFLQCLEISPILGDLGYSWNSLVRNYQNMAYSGQKFLQQLCIAVYYISKNRGPPNTLPPFCDYVIYVQPLKILGGVLRRPLNMLPFVSCEESRQYERM